MLGAIVGDIVGSVYEFNNIKTKKFPLLSKGCDMTDDSIMTIAVADIMKNGYINDKEKIIDTFKKWGKRYPYAGYGAKFFDWVLGEDKKPYNSCGNGSAMRVSPVAWYANSPKEVVEYAIKVTKVTHNHPEGIKGAVVTAMCIYYARIGKSKNFIKKYVEKYYDINFDYEELRKNYYHGAEICQVTVPQAIYCFLISKDFEDCVRTTISIGGDCDTTAAISCAIAEAYYGIPSKIKNKISKYLTEEMKEVLSIEQI
jgi:ADP-ribosylglycohydrolase